MEELTKLMAEVKLQQARHQFYRTIDTLLCTNTPNGVFMDEERKQLSKIAEKASQEALDKFYEVNSRINKLLKEGAANG